MEDGSESLLSPELMEELGGDVSDLIVAKKNKKDKRKRSEEVSEEVKVLAKKMSKAEQKRIDQIRNRKEKESKRSDYLQVINDNSISDLQRKLMVSSNDVGQSQTMKQLLASILKKQMAGLPITEQERNLLYKQSNESDDEDMMAVAFPVLPPVPVQPVVAPVAAPVEPPSTSLLFSFDSLQDDPKPNVEASSETTKPKKTKKEAKKDSSSSSVNSKPNNVGSKLLEQLAALKKAKLASSSSVITKLAVDSDSDNEAPALVPVPEKPSQSTSNVVSAVPTSMAAQRALAAKHENQHSLDRYLAGKTTYQKSEVVVPVNEFTGEILKPSAASAGADDVLTAASASKKSSSNRVKFSLNRPTEVEVSRMQLPVCSMEQEIMEAVINNDVVILCGETGSGKSTQVPQFLYEGGFARDNRMIGITQPRRVAVTSTANRVAYEVGAMDKEGKYLTMQDSNSSSSSSSTKNRKLPDPSEGCLVGYQIRFDSTTVGSDTRIKFMTDGILLREITHDLLLRQYNVIILDEAHERGVNTDVLLGLISRTLPLRRAQHAVEQAKWNKLSEEVRQKYEPPLAPLKLIIMSATMRVTDFQNPRLFPSPPPIIQVEARQYPVTTHFARKTELKNYLQAAHKKVCQIHRKLPEGGVLLFLTGKREILYMCHKLNKSLNSKKTAKAAAPATAGGISDSGISSADLSDKRANAKKVDEAFVSLGSNEEEAEEDQIDPLASLQGSAQFDDELEHDMATVENAATSSKKDKKRKSGSSGTASGGVSRELDLTALYRQYGRLGSGEGEQEQDEIDTDLDDDSDEEEEEEETKKEEEKPAAVVTDEAEGAVLSVREQMLREALKAAQGDAAAETGAATSATATKTDSTSGTTPAVPTEELPPPEPLKALILPLYAMMPPALQAKIFASVPPGYRLIVVATNVAETSITIPNIRYVVDSGRHKEKVQQQTGGAIAKYEVRFISKASADQRQGRSGRTGPGHCYRLYSSNFYHAHMEMFQPPEITCTPLEDLILQMKAIGIDHIESFPFPTAPPSSAIRSALSLLTYLGAVHTAASVLDAQNANQIMAKIDSTLNAAKGKKLPGLEDTRGLTSLGQRLVKFPISPRFAKMLVLAQDLPHLLPYVLTMVATLTEKSVFTYDEQSAASLAADLKKEGDSDSESDSDDLDSADEAALKSEKQQLARKKFLAHHEHGDALARLRGAGAYMYTVSQHINALNSQNAGVLKAMQKASEAERVLIQHKQLKYQLKNKSNASVPSVEALCEAQHLHQPALQSIMELRGQLQDICEGFSPSSKTDVTVPIPCSPPSQQEELQLRQILLRGYCDSIAKLVPLKVITEGSHLKQTTAYYSCNPAVTQPLYLHPTSNLYDRNHDHLPKYVLYGSLIQNKKGDTTYMTCNTVIDERWIASLAEDCPLLTFSAPLASPTPFYDASKDVVMCYVTPSFGARNWTLPSVQRPLFEYSLKALCPSLDVSASGEGVSRAILTALAKVEGSTPLGYRKMDESYRYWCCLCLY